MRVKNQIQILLYSCIHGIVMSGLCSHALKWLTSLMAQKLLSYSSAQMRQWIYLGQWTDLRPNDWLKSSHLNTYSMDSSIWIWVCRWESSTALKIPPGGSCCTQRNQYVSMDRLTSWVKNLAITGTPRELLIQKLPLYIG